MKLYNSELLAYSTIRIECILPNGGTSCGTGFFFDFLEDKENNTVCPCIITNKHVINGAKVGTFVFTIKDKSTGLPIDGAFHRFKIDNFSSVWKLHPNKDVDLCVMPIADLINMLGSKGIDVFYVGLQRSMIPTESQKTDIQAMQDIVMIGYPNGIWDSINNLPIFRKGITATHPNKDYNGKKEFIIDAACFNGSSGSPVFIYDEKGYIARSGTYNLTDRRLYFMGVLYAGPQHTVVGNVVTAPIGEKSLSIAGIPNNLGFVIKSERVLELEKLL